MTSPPGQKAEGQVRTSVARGLGNLSRPPVMADVARLAGVSHQTVSRVLNEHPNVRPLTREKVLAAIREKLGTDEKRKTSSDLMFTVETVACLGACGLAPVAVIETVKGPRIFTVSPPSSGQA